MRVYLAARYGRRLELLEYAKQLDALGFEITSRWLYRPEVVGVRETLVGDQAWILAAEDQFDIAAADAFVVFPDDPFPAVPGSQFGGHHVEFGLALAWDKRCLVVGAISNIFHRLPGVQLCRSWEAAKAALLRESPDRNTEVAANAAKTAEATFVIVVDTREQQPYDFASVKSPQIRYEVVSQALESGDYSVVAPLTATKADRIVVERKSLADLYSTLGHGRERFEREFQRMAEYGYAAVVIEADWLQIIMPDADARYLLTERCGKERLAMVLPAPKHQSLMTPKSVSATLLAWSQRYGVHIFACPGRVFAEKLTYRLLERWARDHQ